MKLEILCYVTGCVLGSSWNVSRANEISDRPQHPLLSDSITVLSEAWIFLALSEKSRGSFLYGRGFLVQLRIKDASCNFYVIFLLKYSETLSQRRVLCEIESTNLVKYAQHVSSYSQYPLFLFNGRSATPHPPFQQTLEYNTWVLIHNILSPPVQWQVSHTPSSLWRNSWVFGFLSTHSRLLYLIYVILFLT
jgi:hypothetical protein